MNNLMKKLLCGLLGLVMAAAAVGCGGNGNTADPQSGAHTHTETGPWQADVNVHWKNCSECEEPAVSQEHTLNDLSECEICHSEILRFEDFISIYTYDDYDSIIRMADYELDETMISEMVYEYEYDADGHVLRITDYIDGKYSAETEFVVRDGESEVVKHTGFDYEDGTKFVNEYDDYGNMSLLISYDSEGNEDYRCESSYAQHEDGEWYVAASTEYYHDGTKIELLYDDQESVLSRVSYAADGTVASNETWEYTYADNGFVQTEKAYVDEVLVTETINVVIVEDEFSYSYPETITTYYEDGGYTVCVYNEAGELVSEKTYDASGNLL